MLIRCPECHFERDIDGDTIPANATVATCPRCGTRFRFRDLHEAQTVPTASDTGQAASSDSGDTQADTDHPSAQAQSTLPVPHLPTEQEGDDPLPPGAVIPHMDDEDEADEAPEKVRANTAPESQADQEDGVAEPRKAKRSWFGLGRRADQDSSPADDRHPAPWTAPDEAHDRGSGEGDSKSTPGGGNDVPWENPERYGFFSSFIQTVLRVMFHAPDFFRQLGSSTSPLIRPAFFYVLLNFFQTIMSRVWFMNSPQEFSQGITDPQVMAQLMQNLNTPLMLVMTPFIMILQLFVFAAFYHVMIRLAQPDRADFSTVVRVIAYSAAPLVLSVVPLMGMVGSLWFLASTVVGCKYALNLSWFKTALALIPLFLLAPAVVLALIQVFALVLAPAAS